MSDQTQAVKISDDDMRAKKYFGPNELGDAEQFLGALTAAASKWTVGEGTDRKLSPIPVYDNFTKADGTTELNEGFGILVKPILERAGDGQKMRVIGLATVQVPSVETVLKDAKGAKLVEDLLNERFGRRVSSIINSTERGKPILPETVEAFLEQGKRTSDMATFNDLAPDFIKALKEMGMKGLAQPTFKAVLMSAQFASGLFPKMEAKGQFVVVLDRMIAKAKSKGLDPAILETWKAERNETTMDTVDDIDLSELAV